MIAELGSFIFLIAAIIFAYLWYQEKQKKPTQITPPSTIHETKVDLPITDANLIRFATTQKYMDVVSYYMKKESADKYRLIFEISVDDLEKMNKIVASMMGGGTSLENTPEPIPPQILSTVENFAQYGGADSTDVVSTNEITDLQKIIKLFTITFEIKDIFRLELNNGIVITNIPLKVTSSTTTETKMVVDLGSINNLGLTSDMAKSTTSAVPRNIEIVFEPSKISVINPMTNEKHVLII